MGLETATFVSGLTEAWPPGGDTKSQGDDHLRLIKSVLKNTFPNASKAFRFPSITNVNATATVPATAQNASYLVDTNTTGNVTLTLPTLTASDAGWRCKVMKITGDANFVFVFPASGVIVSRSGSTNFITVAAYCEPATFEWNGGSWVCWKPGPPIGSIVEWHTNNSLLGYIECTGASFGSSTYAELFSVLGSSILPDHRGRTVAGVDGGAGRLTTTYFASPTLGQAGGVESNTLTASHMPVHFHTLGISDPGHSHGINTNTPNFGVTSAQSGGPVFGFTSTGATVSAAGTGVRVTSGNGLDTTNNAGGGAAHANVQPTIIERKMIRAA